MLRQPRAIKRRSFFRWLQYVQTRRKQKLLVHRVSRVARLRRMRRALEDWRHWVRHKQSFREVCRPACSAKHSLLRPGDTLRCVCG